MGWFCWENLETFETRIPVGTTRESPIKENNLINSMGINYNITTSTTSSKLQLQHDYIALRYTTLHPAVVGEATTATTRKVAATFRSISEFALPSMCHNNSPLL